jgi:hypothetical protein
MILDSGVDRPRRDGVCGIRQDEAVAFWWKVIEDQSYPQWLILGLLAGAGLVIKDEGPKCCRSPDSSLL